MSHQQLYATNESKNCYAAFIHEFNALVYVEQKKKE